MKKSAFACIESLSVTSLRSHRARVLPANGATSPDSGEMLTYICPGRRADSQFLRISSLDFTEKARGLCCRHTLTQPYQGRYRTDGWCGVASICRVGQGPLSR